MEQTFKNFVIRDWQPRDRQPAAQLIAAVLQEFSLCCEPEGADRDVLEVEKNYLEAGGAFWVVEQMGGAGPGHAENAGNVENLGDSGRSLVGTAGFMPIPRGKNAVEIRKMYLHPTARGQGLGRHLLETLEQKIWQQDFEQIWLETASVLKGAVILYEKFGYQALDASEVETDRCDRVYRKTKSLS